MATITYNPAELKALALSLAPYLPISGTPPVVIPPVVTPPIDPGKVPWVPPAGAFPVYAYGGTRGFTLDNSYGGLLVNYQDTTHPLSPGPNCISLKGNNGGHQPRYRDPGNFSTAGFTALVIVAILQPGQDFQLGMDQSNGSGGDAIIPGASQAYLVAGGYGPKGDGKTYQVYKIPLGKGGFNLPVGQNILKYSCQNSGEATPETVAYIGGEYFIP